MGEVHGIEFLESALPGFYEKEIGDDGSETVAAGEGVAEAIVDAEVMNGVKEVSMKFQSLLYYKFRESKIWFSVSYQFDAAVMAIEKAL